MEDQKPVEIWEIIRMVETICVVLLYSCKIGCGKNRGEPRRPDHVIEHNVAAKEKGKIIAKEWAL